MKRGILAFAVLATLGALVGLFLEARPKSTRAMMSASKSSEPADTASAPTPSATATPVRLAADEPGASPPEDEELEEMTNEVLPHDLKVVVLGEVPERIYQAAAADCYQGEEGSAEAMEIDFELVYENGRARLVDIELVESYIESARLVRCVLETMHEMTWTDDEMGDFRQTMSANISMLGLRKRSPEGHITSGSIDDDDEGPGLVNQARRREGR